MVLVRRKSGYLLKSADLSGSASTERRLLLRRKIGCGSVLALPRPVFFGAAASSPFAAVCPPELSPADSPGSSPPGVFLCAGQLVADATEFLHFPPECDSILGR